MVDRIYPTELQLNRANSSESEALFLDLNLYIYLMVQFPPKFMINGTIFDIVNFPFLGGDVLRRTSYVVYISQLIRFARAS